MRTSSIEQYVISTTGTRRGIVPYHPGPISPYALLSSVRSRARQEHRSNLSSDYLS